MNAILAYKVHAVFKHHRKGRTRPVREKSTPLREFSTRATSPEQGRIYFSSFFHCRLSPSFASFLIHILFSFFFYLFSIPALYHIPRRETSTKLTTDTLTQQNTVMIIAKKLIKNAVGMYQFTFTPFRLLSSHRGIEAHIGPRPPHSREKSPLCIGSFSSPGSLVFSSYFSQPCVSCSRARPFTLPLILLPLLATLIVSSVSLQSVPQLYP